MVYGRIICPNSINNNLHCIGICISKSPIKLTKCSPFIKLYLGSIGLGMDRVLSNSYYKGTL